jgi:hypothetical protein
LVLANSLAQQVEKVLIASVGEFIAKATLKKNCALIGVTPDNLTADKLDDLADNIEKSVAFFSGKDQGSEVAQKIRGLR